MYFRVICLHGMCWFLCLYCLVIIAIHLCMLPDSAMIKDAINKELTVCVELWFGPTLLFLLHLKVCVMIIFQMEVISNKFRHK